MCDFLMTFLKGDFCNPKPQVINLSKNVNSNYFLVYQELLEINLVLIEGHDNWRQLSDNSALFLRPPHISPLEC